jgi:hypothetical protein
MAAIVSDALPSAWIMNRRGALAVMRPIERPSRSVNCQTVPPFAGVTITSMVNLEPLRRANKPLQQPMAELPSSAAAAFSVLEGLPLRIDPRSSEWRLMPICAIM